MGGLGIDGGLEARQPQLYQPLATAFEPTLSELGVGATAVAAFALLGMAAQLGYWQHFQRKDDESMGAAAPAHACAPPFVHGAASSPTSRAPRRGPRSCTQRSFS